MIQYLITARALLMSGVILCGGLTGCAGAKADTESAENPDTSTESAESGFESDTTSEVETVLIDNCDDGNRFNDRGGYWGTFDDRWDGSGQSVVWPTSLMDGGEFEMSEPGFGGSGFAARMTGTTAGILGWDYVAIAMSFSDGADCPAPRPSSIDFSQYDGICFMAKGSLGEGQLEFVLPHMKDGAENNCTANDIAPDTLTEYSDYFVNIEDRVGKDWSRVHVDFHELAQPLQTDPSHRVDLGTVLAHLKEFNILYKNGAGGEVDLWLDDVALYRTASHSPILPDAGTDGGHGGGRQSIATAIN